MWFGGSCLEVLADHIQLPVGTLTVFRLTNKQWGDIATSTLWETFETDLLEKQGRSLDTLLESPPGGFLDSVKNLSIRKGFQFTASRKSEVATRLVQLLCALPRDSLHSCTAEYEMDCRTIGLLIKNQTQLHRLSAPTFEGNVPGKGYLANNLEHLTRLTICPSEDEGGYGEWFRHTPMLRHLVIQKPTDNPSEISLKVCSTTPDTALLDLRSLRLQGVHLPPTSKPLTPWLELSSLQDLTLHTCSGMESFLEYLAQEFFSLNKSSLRSLFVVQPRGVQDWEYCLGAIFKFTPTLETLYVSSHRGEYVRIRDLTHVGASLRHLLVEPLANLDIEAEGDQERVYQVQELEELVATCPNLEELGLSLVHLNTGQWHALTPIVIFPSSERESNMKEKQLAKALVRHYTLTLRSS